ncbi:MAG: ATP12 family protein [Alphaproteobacteria bacterium]
MKRFYKTVSTVSANGGFSVCLDGRPILTPGRARLIVPTAALAEAVAAEWEEQTEEINPAAMGLTRLVNSALDRAAAAPGAILDQVMAYVDTDLVCYRSDEPPDLAAAQAAAWDPVVAWAERRFDIHLALTTALLPQAQSPAVHQALRAAVAARQTMALAALGAMTQASGSLLVALAVAEGALAAEPAWRAVRVDERWQASRWGEDAEATRLEQGQWREFSDCVRFLDLLRPSPAAPQSAA